jgi:hypothetical protein
MPLSYQAAVFACFRWLRSSVEPFHPKTIAPALIPSYSAIRAGHRTFAVERRAHQMGVRMAVGAQPASMNQAKFDALSEYRTSSLLTDADRAALD